MLEGFSALALARGLHGWRTTRASSSSSMDLSASQRIFDPGRAGAGSGTPSVTSRESAGIPLQIHPRGEKAPAGGTHTAEVGAGAAAGEGVERGDL